MAGGFNMKTQIDTFNATGKLPSHPFIICSTSGCDTKTTCFSKNLESKIKLYNGLEQLLSTFTCKVCRVGTTPLQNAKIKKVVIRAKRMTKTDTRAALVQDLINNAPKMDFSPRKPVGFLRDSPETVRSITADGSCIRPDIFLNSGRKCDDCGYNNCCQSKVKTFSKTYTIEII